MSGESRDLVCFSYLSRQTTTDKTIQGQMKRCITRLEEACAASEAAAGALAKGRDSVGSSGGGRSSMGSDHTGGEEEDPVDDEEEEEA